jgi:hypothetical protein
MTDLYADLGLSVDDLIQAKVRAHNTNGYGEYSEINTSGSTIQTLPEQMAAPSFDSSSSTNT